MLSSSTGHRTWGSATLLALDVLNRPRQIFGNASSPIHVLELGSGTGLVGLAAAFALQARAGPFHVCLTDFDDDALANLQHNVTQNLADVDCAREPTDVQIKKLDWASCLSLQAPPGFARQFDIILAADVVYEPDHVRLVHAAVSCLLRFPEPGRDAPSFHVVVPLRPTHAAEHDGFDEVFSVDAPGSGWIVPDDTGRRWRLVTVSRRERTADDGFGGKTGRPASAVSRSKVTQYRMYCIQWQAIG